MLHASPTTKEQQAIFRNTHEAIAEEAVFERVQELRANKRRPAKAERQGMFSGLVFCADCGSKLHFAACRSFDGSQDHYRGRLCGAFHQRGSPESNRPAADICSNGIVL